MRHPVTVMRQMPVAPALRFLTGMTVVMVCGRALGMEAGYKYSWWIATSLAWTPAFLAVCLVVGAVLWDSARALPRLWRIIRWRVWRIHRVLLPATRDGEYDTAW